MIIYIIFTPLKEYWVVGLILAGIIFVARGIYWNIPEEKRNELQ
jgi:hypothetical protein